MFSDNIGSLLITRLIKQIMSLYRNPPGTWTDFYSSLSGTSTVLENIRNGFWTIDMRHDVSMRSGPISTNVLFFAPSNIPYLGPSNIHMLYPLIFHLFNPLIFHVLDPVIFYLPHPLIFHLLDSLTFYL